MTFTFRIPLARVTIPVAILTDDRVIELYERLTIEDGWERFGSRKKDLRVHEQSRQGRLKAKRRISCSSDLT